MGAASRPRRRAAGILLAVALTVATGIATAAITAAAGDLPAGRPAGAPDPAATAPRTTADSLLLSAQALALIEAARAGTAAPAVAAGAPGSLLPPSTELLHLSAIVHHGPGDWRIWLNGETWTPATRRATLEIVAVTADGVRLVWRGDRDGSSRTVTLAPNQSYRTRDGVIVEGRPALATTTFGRRIR